MSKPPTEAARVAALLANFLASLESQAYRDHLAAIVAEIVADPDPGRWGVGA